MRCSAFGGTPFQWPWAPVIRRATPASTKPSASAAVMAPSRPFGGGRGVVGAIGWRESLRMDGGARDDVVESARSALAASVDPAGAGARFSRCDMSATLDSATLPPAAPAAAAPARAGLWLAYAGFWLGVGLFQAIAEWQHYVRRGAA